MSFDPHTHAVLRDGAQRSAATVVPLMMKLLNPRSVVDVGCGEGWWLREFGNHGCTVWGVDDHDGQDLPFTYRSFDLVHTGPLNVGPADLVLCLDVAQRLPEARADWLINTLTTSAGTVLFSAAIPGQGGVNAQPPGYWAQRFEEHRFRVTGALRWQLWDLAPHAIETWYVQNLLLAMRDPGDLAHLFEGPAATPIHVIHPASQP